MKDVNVKSRFITVDKIDNPTGYGTKEEIREKGLLYRVSALWITNSKGEILIARRALTKMLHPGEWGPAAAGTVEKGESYIENIRKEAREELGIKNLRLKVGPKVRLQKSKHFTQWYLCSMDKSLSEFRIQKDEVAGIKWVSKAILVKEMKKNPSRFLPSLHYYINIFR